MRRDVPPPIARPEPHTLPPVSVFDLDRTLTRRSTFTPSLLALARVHPPYRWLALLGWPAAFAAHVAGLMSRERLKRAMHRSLLGPAVPRALAVATAERFAEEVVATGLFADARAALEAERAAGRRLLIASAANSLVLVPIARRLDVPFVGTASRWSADALLPGSEGANCYGAAKARAVEAWLAERGGTPHLRVFSDHMSDAPLFELADEAVAVNPGRALARLAARRGWRVVRWR